MYTYLKFGLPRVIPQSGEEVEYSTEWSAHSVVATNPGLAET